MTTGLLEAISLTKLLIHLKAKRAENFFLTTAKPDQTFDVLSRAE